MATEKLYFSRLQEIKQRDVEVLLKKAYRDIWEKAIKTYSDSAQFFYELLQNADDATASSVEFKLKEDGLYSDKIDEQKIGKFGIGFNAVFPEH